MSEKLFLVESLNDWERFVQGAGGHVLQSAAWGEFKRRFGWSPFRLALAQGDRLVAGAQVLLRRLPLGLCLGYVPRGPVLPAENRPALEKLLNGLAEEARRRGAFALTTEPNWVKGADRVDLRRLGARASRPIQPLVTIHVDLDAPLDAILAQMKAKWRYNIRLASRKGVTVRVGEEEDLPVFYRLLQVTGERDGFAIHSLDYYRAALAALGENARLFLAEYEKEPLAAIIVTAYGEEAVYLYGASSNAHRETMPNHALHWAAIEWAKARGCGRYDLWGVHIGRQTGDSPDGLYQFKQGFGGRLVEYTGAFDLVFSRPKYELYRRAIALRRGGLGA